MINKDKSSENNEVINDYVAIIRIEMLAFNIHEVHDYIEDLFDETDDAVLEEVNVFERNPFYNKRY